MRTAFLARHGESVASVAGLVNGDLGSEIALTEVGREQARALGRALAAESIDLCVTSEFPRVRETAELALEGREVPRLELPELNEIGFGRYEGRTIVAYRVWAGSAGPQVDGPGGAESRAAAARRYARAFRTVLERPEDSILVVAHALPLRYILTGPAQLIEPVPLASAYRLDADELRAAVERLEAWCEAPAW